MPIGTRVHNCVDRLRKKGVLDELAIPFCQKATKQNFKTGKKISTFGNKKSKRK